MEIYRLGSQQVILVVLNRGLFVGPHLTCFPLIEVGSYLVGPFTPARLSARVRLKIFSQVFTKRSFLRISVRVCLPSRISYGFSESSHRNLDKHSTSRQLSSMAIDCHYWMVNVFDFTPITMPIVFPM